jgi:hypothetical protein
MNLETRVKKLEGKVGSISRVDPKDKLQVILVDKSNPEEEFEKRKQEMVKKYGEEALEEILFVTVRLWFDE